MSYVTRASKYNGQRVGSAAIRTNVLLSAEDLFTAIADDTSVIVASKLLACACNYVRLAASGPFGARARARDGVDQDLPLLRPWSALGDSSERRRE